MVEVRIYEPIYEDGQTISEPLFIPLDIRQNNYPAWREFRILTDIYRQGLHKGDGFTGLFSPKFRMKTKVAPEDFISFAERHEDSDVCLINMAAQLSVFSFNVWMQGEVAHPGLTKIAKDIVEASEAPVLIDENARHGADILCYSNFWIAKEAFWDRYVGGILLPIADFIEGNQNSEIVRAAFDKTTHSVQCEFLPFVVERLFTAFLHDYEGKSSAYEMEPLACCINDFEREIVKTMAPIVQDADQNGVFSDELRAQMLMLCKLAQMYGLSHYSIHPHPHTGHPLQLPR